MEKPRKKFPELNDTCTVEYACAYNTAIDAMSTWLEGEVVSEYEIADIIRELDPKGAPRKLSKAIHALITRKLTGKV